ncbi:unnamed protein product, partial [Amoebophrya sp. A25]
TSQQRWWPRTGGHVVPQCRRKARWWPRYCTTSATIGPKMWPRFWMHRPSRILSGSTIGRALFVGHDRATRVLPGTRGKQRRKRQNGRSRLSLAERCRLCQENGSGKAVAARIEMRQTVPE